MVFVQAVNNIIMSNTDSSITEKNVPYSKTMVKFIFNLQKDFIYT